MKTSGLQSGLSGEKIPPAGNALEFMRSALGEFQPGAGDEVGHDPRNQDLAGLRLRHDAGSGVDGDAADVAVPQFDLAGVKACPEWQPDLSGSGAECQRAANRAAGTIEGREDSIAGRLDEIAPELLDRLPRDRIVVVQQAAPGLIAHRGCATRGIDDVGEQYGRKNTLDLDRGAIAASGDELLDIAEKFFDIAGPENMVITRIFDEFGVRYLARERAACRDGHLKVARAMQNEGWNPDTGKDRANIDFCVQQRNRLDCAGTGRKPFDLGEHVDPLRLCDQVRR